MFSFYYQVINIDLRMDGQSTGKKSKKKEKRSVDDVSITAEPKPEKKTKKKDKSSDDTKTESDTTQDSPMSKAKIAPKRKYSQKEANNCDSRKSTNDQSDNVFRVIRGPIFLYF